MINLTSIIRQLKSSLSSASPVSLDIWLYSLVFSLGFTYVFLTWILDVAPPSSEFTEYNSSRLNRLNEGNTTDTIKIIMLGDSRLRYATYTDREMEEILTVNLGVPVKVTRIVNNWAVFHDFSQLTTLLLSISPDLIIIQANLLSKGRADIANKFISREYLFWRYFKSNSWNPGDLDQVALQHEMRCLVLNTNETVEERRQRGARWLHFKEGSLSQNEISEFLENTTARNIPVLFISIPITTAGKEGLPAPVHPPEKTIEEIAEPIDDLNFCDIVHMNENGRAIYSNWLSTLITQKLKPNSP